MFTVYVVTMKIRVELPDGNARKLDTSATTVDELLSDIQAMLNSTLPGSFLLHYFDSDFGNYFTLDHDSEIEDTMTVKVVVNTGIEVAATVAQVNGSDDGTETTSSTSTCNLRMNASMANYVLPKFDKDIEVALQTAAEQYRRNGTTTTVPHGLKSRILTRLVADIYDTYSAYPTAGELETVAKALVAKCEGIKDTGRGHDGWWNSLIFKMGNYRSTLRHHGSLEMKVHGGKRSKYRTDLPPARLGMKKLKPGVINWQPELPDGEDESSLRKHQADMITEMGKANPDHGLLSKKMALTFALRRTDINNNQPISELKNKWPALFSIKQIEMEFHRVTNITARRTLYAKLDEVLDKLITILGQRGGSSGRQIQAQLARIDSVTDQADGAKESPAYVVSDDGSYLVIVEGVTICWTTSSCDAFLLLFMAHYIFNLQYNTNKLFFRFVQEFLVGLQSPESKMPPKLHSFFDKINTA